MLYDAYQAQRDLTAPMVTAAAATAQFVAEAPEWWSRSPLGRLTFANATLLAQARLVHQRPDFRITHVTTPRRELAVREETVLRTPFASLLHFSTDESATQPRVLLVTALAGHFSTLLRPTVQSLVADHDVYVTDWHNARDIPLDEGAFGLDDYIAQLLSFLGHLGPGTHIVAVCQPCPAALAATAILAAGNSPDQPRSLTLMAGPIDTRVAPTAVNDLAVAQPLDWFEHNVLTTVPFRYRGAGRRVYPGFLQVGAFMSMHPGRHVSRYLELYNHLMRGEAEQAGQIQDFYAEYFTVLDLAAEFYLETVDRVFQRHVLPRGELSWRGEHVDPGAIRRTALLTVEGQNDDICSPGQTLAAHDLCTRIRPARKQHHLQPGVGHYGVFSGSRWQRQIYPVVRNFIAANN
jgi:polyhydroxyalkanoate depolymerase